MEIYLILTRFDRCRIVVKEVTKKIDWGENGSSGSSSSEEEEEDIKNVKGKKKYEDDTSEEEEEEEEKILEKVREERSGATRIKIRILN